ncbi:MAG: hypothetical protein V4555_04635, partial [Acidobacteriota bacterium]
MAEEQLLPARWGQERRLEFIEFRLQWEGRVNRSDLVNYFSISVPQASLDFAGCVANAKADDARDVFMTQAGSRESAAAITALAATSGCGKLPGKAATLRGA